VLQKLEMLQEKVEEERREFERRRKECPSSRMSALRSQVDFP